MKDTFKTTPDSITAAAPPAFQLKINIPKNATQIIQHIKVYEKLQHKAAAPPM